MKNSLQFFYLVSFLKRNNTPLKADSLLAAFFSFSSNLICWDWVTNLYLMEKSFWLIFRISKISNLNNLSCLLISKLVQKKLNLFKNPPSFTHLHIIHLKTRIPSKSFLEYCTLWNAKSRKKIRANNFSLLLRHHSMNTSFNLILDPSFE